MSPSYQPHARTQTRRRPWCIVTLLTSASCLVVSTMAESCGAPSTHERVSTEAQRRDDPGEPAPDCHTTTGVHGVRAVPTATRRPPSWPRERFRTPECRDSGPGSMAGSGWLATGSRRLSSARPRCQGSRCRKARTGPDVRGTGTCMHGSVPATYRMHPPLCARHGMSPTQH